MHVPAAHPVEAAGGEGSPVIFVVDDDPHVRGAIHSVLEDAGQTVEVLRAARHFSMLGARAAADASCSTSLCRA
jgi:FixJ family two-component response regulator